MKKSLLLILSLYIAIASIGQVTEIETDLKKRNIDSLAGWEYGGVVSLNFSQMHFSDTWAAGGQSSYTTNGLMSVFANYKTEISSWDNTLDIGYGFISQDTATIKTDDKIEFTSKYGKKASNHWFYAALFSFRTQMDKGYNYPDMTTPISNFFAPAYFLGAVGMDYKPSENLSVFAAPITGKLTIVNDQNLANKGAFGVKPAVIDTITNTIITPGKTRRKEVGGYIKVAYKRNLMENVTLQTKIDLFSNYLTKPENLDVSWEVLISMKINKYLSTNISTYLVYDDDVVKDIQFKEVLGVGFSYKLEK